MNKSTEKELGDLPKGATVSRETYADLFAVIGTTYGRGDGSTTFNLPDLRDRYIIGANTNALGTQVSEQLPNIRGATSVRKNNFLNVPRRTKEAKNGKIKNY